jgi:hypothetical protein
VIDAGLIDQLDGEIADFIVGARPVFGDCGRGSVRTANGTVSDIVKEEPILKDNGLAGKDVACLRAETSRGAVFQSRRAGFTVFLPRTGH